MPAATRDPFLDVNHRLNQSLADLLRALEEGAPLETPLDRARAAALAGQSELRALRTGTGPRSEDAARVSEHLDLLAEVARSAGSAPALARKLLAHLLAEQEEITGRAEPAGKSGSPGPAVPTPPAAGALPGGRPPLTVGSLIGR